MHICLDKVTASLNALPVHLGYFETWISGSSVSVRNWSVFFWGFFFARIQETMFDHISRQEGGHICFPFVRVE